MLALGASALLAIPVAVTLSLVGLPDQDMLQAAVARAESLADLLAQRSPGDRTQGQLTKTKQLRALVAPRTRPKSPLLASGPIVPVAPALVDLIAPQPDLAPAGILPMIVAGPPTLGAILGSSPGTPGVTPPGGGGGTQSNPSLPREPLVTTPAAVPEPGTWAMMLVGFGMIAWRVRASRSRRTLPA